MIYPLLNLFNIYLTKRSDYTRQAASSQATLGTTREFSRETRAQHARPRHASFTL